MPTTDIEMPPRRARATHLLAVAAGALALGWLAYFLAWDALASGLAGRLGGAVRSVTDGKIRDAQPFLAHRFRDVLVIASAIVALWGLNRLAVPRLSRMGWAWLPLGALFFVEANVLLAVLARTGLFWLAMYAGEAGHHDVTRFYVRETIAADADADRLVGIIGSSQAGTQVDEDRINAALGDDLYAAQMNFPAAKPYSLLLLQDDFERAGTDALVLYLSEVSFLRGATMEHIPLFGSIGGMRDFARLGGDPGWDADRVRNGWISALVPAFRYRSLLAQRVLGKAERPSPPQVEPGVVDGDVPPPEASGEDELEVDDEGLPNPKTREDGGADVDNPAFLANLERRLQLLIFGEQEGFQYRALAEFARRADASGVDLYLLPGTVHPLLAQRLPPEARPRMLAAMQELAARYEHVHYVAEDRLPALGPADFKDAAHGSKRGQATFTDGLIEVLREDLLGQTPATPEASGGPLPDSLASARGASETRQRR